MLTEPQKAAKRARSKAHYEANKGAYKERARLARLADPEKARQRVRDWIKRNPEKHAEKSRRAKRKYLGIPDPTRLMPEKCECCGRKITNGRGVTRDAQGVVDHDHTTGKFRGWICNSCNLAIGKLGDSVAGLTRALDYLKRAEE